MDPEPAAPAFLSDGAGPARPVASEERLRALVQNSWDVLSILDGSGQLLYNSPACERIHGFTADELLGRPTGELIHPEDLGRVSEAMGWLLAHPGEPRTVEYRYACRDGRWVWMEAVGVNLLDNPAVRGIVANSRDISEQKAAQEQLRASLERFQELADALPQAVFETDLGGNLQWVNRFAFELFGFAAGTPLAAFNVLDTIVPEQRAEAIEAIAAVLAGRRQGGREYTGLRPDGSQFPIVIHSSPILVAGAPVGMRGIITDLTELKAAQDERDRLRERLRQSEKMEAIGQLAGGVAHDFNNQLGAIMGFAELLAESPSPDQVGRYARNIAKACQRSADLTRQLLAFARRGKLLAVPVDLHLMIREVVELLEHSLDKRIRVEVRLAAAGPLVLGDPSQLQSALMNLAVNARDAMPEGGSLRFSTVEETLDGPSGALLELPAGTYLRLEVADSGTGMTAEVQQRLFEPFFTTKPPGKGTGLGLASVYGTVKSHGGAISVQTQAGHGTCFSLRLPRLTGERTAPEEVRERCTGQGAYSILVIEDEPLVGEMVTAMLERLGYRVTLHSDPSQAVAAFQAGQLAVDLVLLDLVMPGLTGREVFEILRERDPHLRILLSSGYSLSGDAQRMLERGATGFIQKPYRFKQLAVAVAEALKN